MRYLICIYTVVFIYLISSCKKLVEIDPPINSIVTQQVFEDSTNSTSAVLGLYSNIASTFGGQSFLNAQTTIFGSLSADELMSFDVSPFYENSIPSGNSFNYNYWSIGYSQIYQINSCIEGLTKSVGISNSVRSQLLGECHFLRALSYFYLVNFYGDIPLVKSTDWKVESIKGRSKVTEIYGEINKDLLISHDSCPSEYPPSKGGRNRITKWAAAALLARVALYTGDWKSAEQYASEIISASDQFKLESQLELVFKRGSRETIFGLIGDSKVPPFNVTTEGYQFVPYTGAEPSFYFTAEFQSSFTPKDNRKSKWMGYTLVQMKNYSYPNKYKLGAENMSPGAAPSEDYVVIRLAEVYLIRAESRMRLNKLYDSITDLNEIRIRAGLDPINIQNPTLELVFPEIITEWRHEYFSEFAHRWLNLKRWAIADEVLSKVKTNWKPTAVLFPIPLEEISRNPSLTQNPGYQ